MTSTWKDGKKIIKWKVVWKAVWCHLDRGYITSLARLSPDAAIPEDSSRLKKESEPPRLQPAGLDEGCGCVAVWCVYFILHCESLQYETKWSRQAVKMSLWSSHFSWKQDDSKRVSAADEGAQCVNMIHITWGCMESVYEGLYSSASPEIRQLCHFMLLNNGTPQRW